MGFLIATIITICSPDWYTTEPWGQETVVETVMDWVAPLYLLGVPIQLTECDNDPDIRAELVDWWTAQYECGWWPIHVAGCWIPSQKRAVGVSSNALRHEIGHGLGLPHPNPNDCSSKTVMVPPRCTHADHVWESDILQVIELLRQE